MKWNCGESKKKKYTYIININLLKRQFSGTNFLFLMKNVTLKKEVKRRRKLLYGNFIDLNKLLNLSKYLMTKFLSGQKKKFSSSMFRKINK